MHEFKLLKTNPRNRIYQLPFRCRVFPRCSDIVKLFSESPLKFVPGIELDEDLSEGIDKICISDAHSHIERLVFPAFYTINVETGIRELSWRTDTLAGKHTFLIDGGDSESVYHDLVYCRNIMMYNKKGN